MEGWRVQGRWVRHVEEKVPTPSCPGGCWNTVSLPPPIYCYLELIFSPLGDSVSPPVKQGG